VLLPGRMDPAERLARARALRAAPSTFARHLFSSWERASKGNRERTEVRWNAELAGVSPEVHSQTSTIYCCTYNVRLDMTVAKLYLFLASEVRKIAEFGFVRPPAWDVGVSCYASGAARSRKVRLRRNSEYPKCFVRV
jgi:hypothetical protein